MLTLAKTVQRMECAVIPSSENFIAVTTGKKNMGLKDILETRFMCDSTCTEYESKVPNLVGKLYESATPTEKNYLLEHLLSPLSILSIVAVSNGVFGKIKFRNEWQNLRVRLEDADYFHVKDVVALVDHVQQVNFESLEALAHMLTTRSEYSRLGFNLHNGEEAGKEFSQTKEDPTRNMEDY